uniref:YjeF N-terminal domain-containing protein n=1 Tax=Anser cygnoides TaxID=8845 RepID=A0A8B9EP79_ANSCY
MGWGWTAWPAPGDLWDLPGYSGAAWGGQWGQPAHQGSMGSLGMARQWGLRGLLEWPCKAEAEAIEKELLEDYRFGRQQLIEIWGHACAMAVTKVREPPGLGTPRQGQGLPRSGPQPKAGPGLGKRGFVQRSSGCELLPTVCPPPQVQLINDAYNAVVDAVLGAEAELGEGRGPCAGILATLKHVRIPIVSLDVPSGWDVEAGSSSGISPDVLVSLTAPKQCARRFLGRQHFVAGRFVPYDMQKKFELNPPEYPGTECVVPL